MKAIIIAFQAKYIKNSKDENVKLQILCLD